MGTDAIAVPPGLRPAFESAVKAICYIRERDCDFLTVDNVLTYAALTLRYEQAVRLALISEMGLGWYRRMVEYDIGARGWDRIDGQRLAVTQEARHFAVVRGRRWVRVCEYLSNGQLTARWFYDEDTGECREAEGATKPRRWTLASPAKEFVAEIVAQASA